MPEQANTRNTTHLLVPMKQRIITAFCPGHISGYFRRIEGVSVAATGSIGAGIVISEGVTATVSPAEATSVIVNRKDESGTLVQLCTTSPPLEYALKKNRDHGHSCHGVPSSHRGRVRPLGSCTACHAHCSQPEPCTEPDFPRYRGTGP